MSESLRIKPSSVFLEKAQAVLHELLHGQAGVDGVLIASTDGFSVARAFLKNYDEAKLAAVGSSILSLVQAIGTEVQLQGCESLIVGAKNGKVLIDAVSSAHYPMLLVAVTNDNVLLGHLMHGTKKAKAALEDLDAEHNRHIVL